MPTPFATHVLTLVLITFGAVIGWTLGATITHGRRLAALEAREKEGK